MDIIPDGIIRATDHVIAVTAGENLIENDAVHINPADSKAYKCDADDLAKIGFIGFVIADANNGATVYIKVHGHKDGFTGLTPGSIYYLSETAGEITATVPTNYKIVAEAVTSTIVRILQEPTVRVRTYTADDTWTKPAGLKKLFVQVQAGGAGSNAGRNHVNPSAAGGGYTEGWIQAENLGATETVTVGAGGTGEVYGGASATAGGNSSFGSHLQANGGSGTTGGSVPTPGYYSEVGGNGLSSHEIEGTFYMAPPGSSRLSKPFPLNIVLCFDCDVYGYSGVGYGYGGRSNGQDSQPNGINGQDGGPGIIIVTEYY